MLNDFSADRERIVFDNYLKLSDKYSLYASPQFIRFGFFHLEGQREGGVFLFFTRLIENQVYPRQKVLSVIGNLTDSRVIWDMIYDEAWIYMSYTT